MSRANIAAQASCRQQAAARRRGQRRSASQARPLALSSCCLKCTPHYRRSCRTSAVVPMSAQRWLPVAARLADVIGRLLPACTALSRWPAEKKFSSESTLTCTAKPGRVTISDWHPHVTLCLRPVAGGAWSAATEDRAVKQQGRWKNGKAYGKQSCCICTGQEDAAPCLD